MADITVHIGLNKTGTSSIQDFLSMNADALCEEGLVYPLAGRDKTAHHELSYWLKKLPEDADPAAGGIGAALLEEIAGARRVVLSSEDLHTQNARGVQLLARLLEGHRVRVLLYVREHLGYLASWYQQAVQASHMSCSFDTFCHFTRAVTHVIADRWAEAFGQERVQVRLYDRASLKEGDIVHDVASLLELGGDLDRFERKPHESNPSVAGNLLFAKRIVNHFLDKRQGAKLSDDVTALSRLKPEFRGAIQVDPALMAYVTDLHAVDRAHLQKRYGVRIEPARADRHRHPTPDLHTLQDDWDLLQHTADRRGFEIARYLKLVVPSDLSALGIAAPPRRAAAEPPRPGRAAPAAAAPAPAPARNGVHDPDHRLNGIAAAGTDRRGSAAAQRGAAAAMPEELQRLLARVDALEQAAPPLDELRALQSEIDALKKAFAGLHGYATVELKRQVADYVNALSSASAGAAGSRDG